MPICETHEIWHRCDVCLYCQAARVAELERKAELFDEICNKVDLCMQNDVTGYAVVQLVKLFREQESSNA